LLGSALAWILWLYVLNTLPAGMAGLSTLLTPVVGLVSAWAQLGERPSVTEGAGMAAIVGALLLITGRGIITRRLEARGWGRGRG